MGAAVQTEAVRRERSALEVVGELNSLLAETLDLDTLLPALLELLRLHFGIEHGTILTTDGDSLVVRAAIGSNSARVGLLVPMSVGIVGVSATRRRTINIGNMRFNRRYLGAMTGGRAQGHQGLPALEGSDSQIAVPLVVADSLVGVFLAESMESCVFSSEDAELFAVMTTPIAAAIRNGQTLEALEEGHRQERAARVETENALAKLETAQDALVASERLAGLGQLAAGVAHEVNTPLGAITASLGPLQSWIPLLLELLERHHELSAPAWASLVAAISAPRGALDIGTATTDAALKALERHLEQLEIDDADEYADMLVESGLSLDSPELVALLDSEIDLDDLDLLYRARCVSDAVTTIGQASDKAAKVVRALKAYSHQPSSYDEYADVDLQGSLTTVLTMYRNRLKHGVDLKVRVESREVVSGQADQLLQVWTNIIHNALDAMANRGRLHLQVARVGGWSCVTIANDGPRIPDKVRAKLFDAFYTTKPVGQGTGLGLHLCQEIVSAHGGTIRVESDDDWTTFTILLPPLAER